MAKDAYGVNPVFYKEEWCILRDFLNSKKITCFRNSIIEGERVDECW
jgi:hypothetical protein